MKCLKVNETFSAACFQDFRHWSADPNAVKQAFYEWNQQVNKFFNLSYLQNNKMLN